MIKSRFKITVFLTFYFFLFSNLLSIENKIIAKVNNEIITSYELKNKIKTTLILSNEIINQDNIDRTKKLILKSLIDLKVKKDELKKYEMIKVEKSEINNSLDSLSKGDFIQFKNKFQDNKLDYNLYIDELETELRWRKLIFFIYNKKVNIDETEINLELENILRKKNNENVDYKLSELVVSFETEDIKNKKISEIEKSINEIGFENSIQKFSESISKNESGNLGWINSQGLSKDIYDSVKKLKINEITKPIISTNNIIFLKLSDIKKIKLEKKNIEIIKRNILNARKNQMYSLYSNSHLSKLRNEATIEYN